MPDGGSGYAAASNECPTRAASEARFCDHSVRLLKRRKRHSLRRRCEGHRIILIIVSLPSNAVPLLPAKQERPEAGMNRKVPFPPEKLGRVEGVDEAGGDRMTRLAQLWPSDRTTRPRRWCDMWAQKR